MVLSGSSPTSEAFDEFEPAHRPLAFDTHGAVGLVGHGYRAPRSVGFRLDQAPCRGRGSEARRDACGVYYRYKITDGRNAVETGEALALPLLTRKSDKPAACISVANIEGAGGLIVQPVRLDHLTIEFVDVGAGVPE